MNGENGQEEAKPSGYIGSDPSGFAVCQHSTYLFGCRNYGGALMLTETDGVPQDCGAPDLRKQAGRPDSLAQRVHAETSCQKYTLSAARLFRCDAPMEKPSMPTAIERTQPTAIFDVIT